MPEFELSVFEGGKTYSRFGTMYMEKEEWENMKALQIPLDDKIVECSMDKEQRWRFLRFRDDKRDGNHISVVNSVLQSIKDGVEKEDLLREAPDIRTAWKTRQILQPQQQQPVQSARQPPPPQGQQPPRR